MNEANPVCTMLGCSHPIVLAGMGGPSRSELVGAVTQAGGFGFLGMVREAPALITQEVGALRNNGHQRFGINIIPAATPPDLLEAQLETIIRLRVPVVALFWDLDSSIVTRLREADITVVYQTGSVEEAIAAERAGAQIIIAQGREAGGHVRGTRPLRHLLPAAAAAVGVPVLAAGGLATGDDLVMSMALGASGIVLGTAFLATEESFAHSYHKQQLLTANASDTLLTDKFHINWPPGASVRVLSSAVTSGTHEKQASDRTVIGYENDRPIYLFSTDSPLRSMTGDFGSMALYAGTGVGKATSIRKAADVVGDIVDKATLAGPANETQPESRSPVCYAHQTHGAYMGQLEPEEIATELTALLSELRTLLIATLAKDKVSDIDGPPFPPDAQPLARWIARLGQTAMGTVRGKPFASQNSGIDPKTVITRLGRLIPGLPDGGLRSDLVALRIWLEAPSFVEP